MKSRQRCRLASHPASRNQYDARVTEPKRIDEPRANSVSPQLLLAALAAIVGVAHLAILLSGQTWADLHYQAVVVPPRLAAAAQVLHGHLPMWWDGTGLGVPLLAEPSHAALYPLTWLSATPWLFDIMTMAHLVLLAWSAAMVARRLGADDFGALVAGASLALGGMASSSLLDGNIVPLAWLALSMWAAMETAAQPRTLNGWLGVLVIAMAALAVAGRPAWLVSSAVIVIGILFANGRSMRDVVQRALPRSVVVIVLGLAVAAVAILPMALHLGSGVAGTDATPWSIMTWPQWLLPSASVGSIEESRAWLLIGAPIVLWALIGARDHRRVAVATLIAIAAGHALAASTRIAELPVIGGDPHAWLAPAVIGIHVVAGCGFSTLSRPTENGWRMRWNLLAALFAIAVTAFAWNLASRMSAAPAARVSSYSAAIPAAVAATAARLSSVHRLTWNVVVPLLVLPMASVILAWWSLQTPKRGRGIVIIVLAAAVIGPLIAAQRQLMPTVARSSLTTPAEVLTPLLAGATSNPDAATMRDLGLVPRVFLPDRLAVPDLSDERRHFEVGFAGGAGAATSRFDLSSARSASPARQAIESAVWLRGAVAGSRLLGRLSVGWAVLPSTAVAQASLPELMRTEEWSLVSLPTARPRGYVGTHWEWAASDDDAMVAMLPAASAPGTRLLPTGAVLLVGHAAPDAAPSPGGQVGQVVPCDVRAPTPHQPAYVEEHCDAATSGYAVLANSWAPGWRAFVDGDEHRVERAELIALATDVTAGRHTITWQYRPPGLTVGAWISLVAGLLLIALFANGWRVTRRRTLQP